jgi:hypothetical protein
MADLYGSQDVTIRNDDGTKIVTITMDGIKERLDVNASLEAASPQALNVNINWEGTNAPYKADMWLPVTSYTVPAGYDFYPFQVQYLAGNSSSSIRVGENLSMGYLATGTNTFTNGSAYTSPRFASYLELRMTQTCNTNMTITITYVNELGTTGRTATIALSGSGPGQSLNGYTYLITLQSGDVGVRDITNISTSATGNGNFTIYGVNNIIRDTADATTVGYTDVLELGTYIVRSGGLVGLSVSSASTASVYRYLIVSGKLVVA